MVQVILKVGKGDGEGTRGAGGAVGAESVCGAEGAGGVGWVVL